MENSGRTGSRQGRSDGVYSDSLYSSDSVHIREVGDPPGGVGGSPTEADARSADPSRPAHRHRPFRAAWIFTGILLGVGLLWAGGVFDTGPAAGYATTVSVDPATGMPVEPDLPPLSVLLQNLASIAPVILLTGLASAAALLITQGALRSRESDRTAPAPAP